MVNYYIDLLTVFFGVGDINTLKRFSLCTQPQFHKILAIVLYFVLL